MKLRISSFNEFYMQKKKQRVQVNHVQSVSKQKNINYSELLRLLRVSEGFLMENRL